MLTPTPIPPIDHTTQWLSWSGPILLACIPFVFGMLAKIHTLVNSRLTAALEKIDGLELKLKKLTGEEPTGEPPKTK